MEENRNRLIKEIEKNVRQMAHKTFIGVGVLCVYSNADVIVTCTDGSQWKLDCFFFGEGENDDVQLRLLSLDNEIDADGWLENLTTECLSNIEKYLELLK